MRGRVPSSSADVQWTMYKSSPASLLPNTAGPTTPKMNAGPQLLQNRRSLPALFLSMLPAAYSAAMVCAPEGYPPVSPTTSAAAPDPGTPNTGCMTPESARSSGCVRCSAQNRFAHTKNGNSDGTITFAQRESAFDAARLASSGRTISHT